MAMYKPSSVNSMLTSVNRYLDWIGQADCKVKFIKVQRQIFLREEKDLKEWEYRKLLEEANRKSNKQLAVLLQTIAMTGIRISELQYITIEGMKAGRIDVANKGKIRTILLPKELIKVLQKHVKESHIVDGIIFKTKHDKALDRSNIWKMMKRLAKDAGVQLAKVFPHNLRHLFAKTFYKIKKDISKLADMLGHSNINTTRIYIMETGSNHINGLNKMNVLLI